MEESRRRIRLKCRYEGELRYVNLFPDLNFAQLKKRLATDYGFEVSLKYEDRDGDLITLSSQNDLDDLIAYTCEFEHDTVNVIVTEAIQLPTLSRRETPKNPTLFPITTTSSIGRQSVGKSYRMEYAGAPTGTSSGSRFDRFPQIDSPMGSLAASFTPRDAINRIRWKRGEVLGQGAFGVVFLGLNVDTGELMAVKQMAIDEVSTKELSSLENEINLLRSLRHPNIVRYIGTEVTAIALSIFLEYVPGGSLKTLIDKFGQLEETVSKSYTRQLLLGLEYLHRNGIAHRDIKGANCLVGNDGVVKLADFGNSKQWRSTGPPDGSQRSGDIKGTPSWMAPEVVRDQGLNISWKKADVWSLACTTLEMSTGKPPWSQFNNSVTTLYHIACQDTLPEYPTDASIELISFLNVCLVRDPANRPDVTSLLLHPFVMSAGIGMWDSSAGGGMGMASMVRPSTVSSSVRGEWDPAGSWRTESRLGVSSTAASMSSSISPFPGSSPMAVGGGGISSIIENAGGSTAFTPSMLGKSLEMQRMDISDSIRSDQNTPRVFGRAETAASTQYSHHSTVSSAPDEVGKVLLDISALAADSDLQQQHGRDDHKVIHGGDEHAAKPRKKKTSRFFSPEGTEVDEYGRVRDHTGGKEMMQSALDAAALVGTASMQSSPTQDGIPYPRPTIPEIERLPLAYDTDDHSSVGLGGEGGSSVNGAYRVPSSTASVGEEDGSTVGGSLSHPGSIGAAPLSDAEMDSDSVVSTGTGGGGNVSSGTGFKHTDRDRDRERDRRKQATDRRNSDREESAASQPKREVREGDVSPHAKAVPLALAGKLSVSTIMAPEGSSVSSGSTSARGAAATASGGGSGRIKSPTKQGKLSSLTPIMKPQRSLEDNANTNAQAISRHASVEAIAELAPIAESEQRGTRRLQGSGAKLIVTGTNTAAATTPTSGAVAAGKTRSRSSKATAVSPSVQSKIPQMSGSSKSNSGKRNAAVDGDGVASVAGARSSSLSSGAVTATGTGGNGVSFVEGEADVGDKASIGGVSDVSSVNRECEGDGYDIADEVSLSSSVAEEDEYFRPAADSPGSVLSWSRLHLNNEHDEAVEVEDEMDVAYNNSISGYSGGANAAEVDSESDNEKFGGRIAHTAAALQARGSPSEFTPGTALTKARPATIAPLNPPTSGIDNAAMTATTTITPKAKRTGRGEMNIGWGSKQAADRTAGAAATEGSNVGAGIGTGTSAGISWMDQKEEKDIQRGFLGRQSLSPSRLVGGRAEEKPRVSKVASQREKAAAAAASATNMNAGSGIAAAGGGAGILRNSLLKTNHRKTSNSSVQLEAAYDGSSSPSAMDASMNFVLKTSSPSMRREGRKSRLAPDEGGGDGGINIRTVTATAMEPSSSGKRSRGRDANDSSILNGSFESLRIDGTGAGGSSNPGHNGFSFADTDLYPSRPRDTAGDPRGAIGTAYSRTIRDEHLDVDSVDDNFSVDHGMGLLSEAPEVLDEHLGAVTRLRCPRRTTILISASVDGTIRLWGAGESQSRMVLDAASFSGGGGSSSAAAGGGRAAVSGDAIDVNNASTPGVRGVKVLNVWAQETCDTIWAACSDGGLRVWTGNDGKQLRLMRGHEDAVTAMEGMSSISGVQAQSSCLVGTGSADRSVRVWDARAKKSQVYMFKGHNDSILALRWGEGGRTLISAGKDKSVRIWDMRGGKLRATLEKHFGAVNALRCIPDLASAAGSAQGRTEGGFFVSAGRDSMINLWSEGGDCVSTAMAHRGSVGVLSDVNYKWQYRSSTFGAPMMLSAGADTLIKVWDLKKFKSVAEIPVGSAVTRAVWADQGIVATSGNTVRLWEYSYGNNGGTYDGSSLTGGAEGESSQWRSRDLVMMSHPCTDLLSTDAFVACGSKSGQIYKWSL